MGEQGSWDEFVLGLCDLAVKYDAVTYLYESVVSLASRTPRHGHESATIRITRFDDEAARIETGWCFDLVVDYVAGDSSRPVPALGLVEAICSGSAEESCLIDAGGRWVGVFLKAWAPNGDRWESGSPGRLDQRATRRFPSWIDPN
ncbi:hypothetical protein [Skermania piniformis]|uniref:Uncharacterized protein n=1 Tax=Skermania pinensis TaxID=39122 RepID=A0ABX8S708_9ACTN|nr:hypothetical protein [Skermania piniformis]QXQ13597.1 hypothetical protein KV203_17570 [Skermania piniformis]